MLPARITVPAQLQHRREDVRRIKTPELRPPTRTAGAKWKSPYFQCVAGGVHLKSGRKPPVAAPLNHSLPAAVRDGILLITCRSALGDRRSTPQPADLD